MGCENLKNVWCRGGMPSFNGNCLWDTSATVYYPHNNAWPMDAVWQVLNSYQNKILIQGGYPPEEATEPAAAVTEPVTEPVQTTAPAETEPAVTEVVATEPETTPPTTEETEAAETTSATEESVALWMEEMEQLQKAREEAEETGEETGGKLGILVGICILSGTLSLALLGALIFRRRRY